jgi:predicted O-methyltransferase YrrM
MLHRVSRKLKSIYLRTYLRSYEQFLRANLRFRQTDAHIFEKIREKLRPAYEQYVREISSPDMAASLELATFLYVVCKVNGYKKVVDLGSGFSSYVFRLYARETSGVVVVSVDDDVQWLGKTRSFMISHNLDVNGMMTIEEFVSLDQPEYDCILLDLNFVEVRINYVEAVMNRIAPGGMIIFDDVHKPDYRNALLGIISRKSGICYSLKPVTLDRFGRYALAFKREN